MSYGQSDQYGGGNRYGDGGYGSGNPYGSSNTYGTGGSGGYEASNPYGSSNVYSEDQYGSSNPYTQTNTYEGQGEAYPVQTPHQNVTAQPYQQQNTFTTTSNFSRPSGRQTPTAQMSSPAPTSSQAPAIPAQPTLATQSAQSAPSSGIMSNQDFLSRVEGVKAEIRQLTSNIAEIGTLHQRALGSPDNTASAQLENLVARTSVMNTKIKDQIRLLEVDAAKSGRNQTKDSQVRTLKSNFTSQLQEYRNEESAYGQRYREQIKRQYRIVNPEATNEEVDEAANADWGNEGVFQTALKSNRTGAANSVLGAVRARHNDIQQINRTLLELQRLFNDLAEAVILQEEPIRTTEIKTGNVLTDTEAGNKELKKAEDHARRARKLKWICFWIVVLILCILALVLGIIFGYVKKRNNTSS